MRGFSTCREENTPSDAEAAAREGGDEAADEEGGLGATTEEFLGTGPAEFSGRKGMPVIIKKTAFLIITSLLLSWDDNMEIIWGQAPLFWNATEGIWYNMAQIWTR